MRYLILCSFIVLITSTQAQKTAEEQLRDALDRFNQFFNSADVNGLSEMLTDSYIHTNSSSGPYDKSQWLNYVKSRKAKLESGALKVVSYTMEDVKIRLYENSAAVSAIVKTETREKGISSSKSFKVTHLWVKEMGVWKRAAFHDCVIY